MSFALILFISRRSFGSVLLVIPSHVILRLGLGRAIIGRVDLYFLIDDLRLLVLIFSFIISLVNTCLLPLQNLGSKLPILFAKSATQERHDDDHDDCEDSHYYVDYHISKTNTVFIPRCTCTRLNILGEEFLNVKTAPCTDLFCYYVVLESPQIV